MKDMIESLTKDKSNEDKGCVFMKMTKAMLAAAMACGTMMSTAAYAAQEVEPVEGAPVYALDAMVVTATRMEKRLVDTAANVNVISAEEISRKNYQSVSEALEDVPGVIVKRSGFGGGDQHVYLNGDDRVLIMVDGRRLNQDKGTSGRSGFDMTNLPIPNYIERIEIMKGAGSSLYGSDAVGGVINIITKSAKKTQVTLNANTGSWGTQNYSAYTSAKVEKTGIVVTASKAKQKYVKFKQADNSQNVKWPNSSVDNIGATVKIDHEIGNDQMATVYFEHSKKDGGKPYYAPALGGWNNLYPVDKGTDLNNNVSAKYAWGLGKDNSGYVQVYRNHYVGNMYRESGHNYYYETKDGIDLQQNVALTDNNKLVMGTEWRRSKVNNPQTYSTGEREITNKSLYLQDIWNLGKDWSVNAGVRYDKHNYFGHKTTSSVAVNKKFNEDSHAYVSWGQVFNAPQANDMFYYSYGYGHGDMLGNPNLKPESGDVWTIGYDAVFAKKTNIGVNAFYSDLKDAIKWAAVDPSSYTSDWKVDNVAKQKKRGLEFNVKHDFNDNWTVNASYAYVKVTENSNNGNGFVRDKNIAPNQYKLGVSYKNKQWNVDVYGRGASGADKASYVDSKYLTLDMSVQYKLKDNWKLYMKGYNLTNAAYAESAGISNGKYNYPAVGRHFLIGTEYTF